MSCDIVGKFYNYNIYNNYTYLIDGKNLYSPTFVSKKLNDAKFEISKIRNDVKINIIIENKEKDFYFPLLYQLTM